MSSSSKPKLYYWDIRALGEPIRLLLRYLEIDFEDKRFPLGQTESSAMESWANERNSHGLDFPNLPFYVDEDVKITQSLAIMQHIGRKYNLCGDTLKEKAIIDMVTQTVNDLRYQALVAFNAPEFHDIKEDWKATIPTRLGEMNKFLEGKDFVLGKKITYVDFLLYETTEWFRLCAPDVFQAPELANLNYFLKRIEALPQIQAYLKSDNFKSWPLFSAFMNFGYSKDPDYKAPRFPIRNFFARYPLEK